jgi:hypothetical protein
MGGRERRGERGERGGKTGQREKESRRKERERNPPTIGATFCSAEVETQPHLKIEFHVY